MNVTTITNTSRIFTVSHKVDPYRDYGHSEKPTCEVRATIDEIQESLMPNTAEVRIHVQCNGPGYWYMPELLKEITDKLAEEIK